MGERLRRRLSAGRVAGAPLPTGLHPVRFLKLGALPPAGFAPSRGPHDGALFRHLINLGNPGWPSPHGFPNPLRTGALPPVPPILSPSSGLISRGRDGTIDRDPAIGRSA